MRIDAHHHVWDPAVHPQSWMTPEQAAVIGGAFTLDDWRAATAGTGVTHAVVVQTVEDVAETRDLLDLAADHQHVLGVVGWVPFGAPDQDEVLDRLTAHPRGRLVGLRDMTEQRTDGYWLAGPDASRTFTAAAERDLAVDLLVHPRHLPAAASAVHAHPGTRFVVDHLGKPDLDASGAQEWARTTAALASAPNVALKFSGFATLTADLSAAGATLADHLAAALDLFGPERVMFGSDWPVALLGASYAQVVTAVEQALERVGTDEAVRQELFAGAATRWYRLEA